MSKPFGHYTRWLIAKRVPGYPDKWGIWGPHDPFNQPRGLFASGEAAFTAYRLGYFP